MKQRKKYLLILIGLIVLFFIVNYHFADNYLKGFFSESQKVVVNRVVDGDTIKSEDLDLSIRLLGVNSPEKGEGYFEEGKNYLESRILNQTVRLEFGKAGQDKYDKYGRLLVYVFLDRDGDEKNINLEMVENGFANYYFPSGRDKDEYYSELRNAWEECIDKEINLCEPSNHSCKNCIEIISRNSIKNVCGFDCDLRGWQIKPEGREIFEIKEIIQKGQGISFDLEINEQDTLFLRDSYGKLVAWQDFES